MSLEADGFWKAGFWATTFWADGFWREGAAAEKPTVNPIIRHRGLVIELGGERSEMVGLGGSRIDTGIE